MTEAAAALSYWSQNHSQSARLSPRGGDQEHRWEIADYIAAMAPLSILEFGCSSGRNLACLRELLPDAELVGIDPNKAALAAGQAHHPSLVYIEGDERHLALIETDSFDVVFTVSVLDHIPTPEWRAVYNDLVRVARVAVVLLEPMYGTRIVDELTSGEVVEHTIWQDADVADLRIHAAPYSFVHNYLGHDPLLRLVRRLPIQCAPELQPFGSLYHLLERAK